MVIEITIKGEMRSTQTVTDGIDPHEAKRLALAAAIKANHIKISEALRAEFHIGSGSGTLIA